MPAKKAIVIGAGISGLSCGCYLAMNGFDTAIYEMGEKAGGVYAASEHQGYLFGGDMDWVAGVGAGSDFHPLWLELEAFSEEDLMIPEILKVIEYKHDSYFFLYSDFQRTCQEFSKLSLQDQLAMNRLMEAVHQYAASQMPIHKPLEIFNPIDVLQAMIKNYGFLKLFNQWRKVSVREFCSELQSEDLKKVMQEILGQTNLPMLHLIMFLSHLKQGAIGVMKGKAHTVVNRLIDKFSRLGGKINYNQEVKKILLKNDKAIGIMTEEALSHEADVIISTADAFGTIFELLDGKYVDAGIKSIYQRLPVYPAMLQFTVGMNHSWQGKPRMLSFPCLDPLITSPDKQVRQITVRIMQGDEGLVAQGKTVLSMEIETDFDYWKSLLFKDIAVYEAHKQKVALDILEILNVKFGKFFHHMESYLLTTPMDIFQATHNLKGSLRGWLPTVEGFREKLPRKLPGLDNFYMSGLWVEIGGEIHHALLSGRNTVQVLCHDKQLKFKSF